MQDSAMNTIAINLQNMKNINDSSMGSSMSFPVIYTSLEFLSLDNEAAIWTRTLLL